MRLDDYMGIRNSGTAWVKILCLLCCCAMAMVPARASVVAKDVDGDGWAAFDANLGVPWTTSLVDVNNDVWGSGQPVSGLGVAFSGPATFGQFGLFDDHIVESTDLVVDLDSLGATQIRLAFYVDSLSYSPNALSVFFRDWQADDWYRDITAPASVGWTSYEIALNGVGWYSPTGGSDFNLALSGGNTQQMGLRLQYEAGVNEEQRYGLADYRILKPDAAISGVPEPSTAGLLIVGGIASWACRRRSLTAGLRRRRTREAKA